MTGEYYNILSTEELDAVHMASLEVLQHTGLHITHPVALEKMSAAGAEVDLHKGQVLLTAEMVDDALKKVPASFICAGRSPEFDIIYQSGSMAVPKVRSAGGPINFFDAACDSCRPLSLSDCKQIAHLADALDHIDIVGSPSPQDTPRQTYDLHTLKGLLEAGRKHVWALPSSSVNLKLQLEMMLAVAGGSKNLSSRPICSGIVCLIEPLHFPDDEIERLLLYSQYKIPLKVPLVPMAGANAPYTLAGLLTQINAEALGSLVLLQTICPGIPAWYYGLPQDMDMVKGTAKFFSPEIMLVHSGLTQLGRHYGIPAAVSAGIGTDSQIHQIMFERGAAMTMSTMSGVAEIGGVGSLDGGLAIGPLILVLDDEMAAFAKRLRQGFQVSPDTLAVEAIQRVGHAGNFLSDSHTLNFLRKEKRFWPTLFDWRSHAEWCTDGATILDRANQKMVKIITEHEVPPLDERLKNELDRIIQSAEA